MFPRVTHPCAGCTSLRPLDLHVLSLPPAFVLSQDQTLMFIPSASVSCASIKKLASSSKSLTEIHSKQSPISSLSLISCTLMHKTTSPVSSFNRSTTVRASIPSFYTTLTTYLIIQFKIECRGCYRTSLKLSTSFLTILKLL